MDRKIALITGGTRGIGLGIARALAQEGIDLLLCGRRPADQVEQVIESLRGFGIAVEYCQADVGEGHARKRLIGFCMERFGSLNFLINNAGMAPRERKDILEATEDSFEEVIRVNLIGPYFLTQLAARWMIEQKRNDTGFQACIVNITSISAETASPSRGEYCVSKAGLAMATKLWAVRLAEFGIPVYEVRPGIIATDMTAAVREKYDRLIAGGLLLQRRWGQPEDIGRAVAALCRGDFAYSTGAIFMVDGGFSVSRL